MCAAEFLNPKLCLQQNFITYLYQHLRLLSNILLLSLEMTVLCRRCEGVTTFTQLVTSTGPLNIENLLYVYNVWRGPASLDSHSSSKGSLDTWTSQANSPGNNKIFSAKAQ